MKNIRTILSWSACFILQFFCAHTVSASCNITAIGTTTISSSVCSINSDTIEGVDIASSELSTTNTSILNVVNSSITINANAGIIAGTVNLVGTGTISTLQSNTFIKTGGIWVADNDADGWSSSVTVLYDATASGRRRLGLMRSLSINDCNDTNDYRIDNQCCVAATYYVDTDNDGYGAGTGISMCPTTGYASNNTDCYNSNANAYPGSTYCSSVHRGDGSFDYNCSGTNTTCSTIYDYSGTSYFLAANHGTGSCKNNNANCRANNATVYAPATIGCGQTGGVCSNLVWHEEGCGECGESPDSQYRCFAVTTGVQACQ